MSMNDMKKSFLVFVLALLCGSHLALADEGMWMVNAIDKAIEKNMKKRGLKLDAREIYNADAEGATLTDAVVSMEFGCTGSIISDRGLLITNHHCAYGDVHSLSTPEHNLLEEGFWAMQDSEEVNIAGKCVYFLKKVVDVTEEVEALKAEQRALGKSDGMRRISWLMEKKYKEGTDLEVMLSSMWRASKYYMAYYEVYRDVRLVAAPPVSSAAFGGDVDNWEWPQHKCDFALYRVYTAPDGSPADYSEENVPLVPEAKLNISLAGYKPGDFTMVIGYPGRTDRYSSSVETEFDSRVKLPISNRLRGNQMEIVRRWMNADPQIRLLYSDYFFNLSNVQEYYCGQVKCVNRFGVVSSKEGVEKQLQEWIDASEDRKALWGTVLDDLRTKYAATEDAERDFAYYRETLIRGTRFARVVPKVVAFRASALLKNGIKPKRKIELVDGPDPVEEQCCSTWLFKGKEMKTEVANLYKEYARLDLRVEKDLFFFAVEQYLDNVSEAVMGPFQRELAASKVSRQEIAEQLWNSSFITDMSRLEAFLSEEHTVADYLSDPVVMFFQDAQSMAFNQAVMDKEGDVSRNELAKMFTHALYQMRLDKGIAQYPDANSTMRLTYGTVGDIRPHDGVHCDWKTTPAGIVEKYDPTEYDFSLNSRQYALYREGDWGRWGFGRKGKEMYVNFITDNDITGGNSGSPVLNAKGELIGLAFDGNKESLASDVWFTPGYCKCVCVDIRFILWTLDKYAGMTRIIDEIGL